jgi:hypothetical protein
MNFFLLKVFCFIGALLLFCSSLVAAPARTRDRGPTAGSESSTHCCSN